MSTKQCNTTQSGNRKKTTLTAIFLVTTIAFSIVYLPPISALVPTTILLGFIYLQPQAPLGLDNKYSLWCGLKQHHQSPRKTQCWSRQEDQLGLALQ